MKKFLQRAHKKIAGVIAGAVGAVTAAVGTAQAALTVDQQAVVDGINTLYGDMSTVGWGFVLTATTLFIGIKVFKKVIGRAT